MCIKGVYIFFFILFTSSLCALNGGDEISETLSFDVDCFLKDLDCLKESYSLAVNGYKDDIMNINEIVDSAYVAKLNFLKKYGKETDNYNNIMNIPLSENYNKRMSFILAYERLMDDLLLEEKSITSRDNTADFVEFIENNPKFQKKRDFGISSLFTYKDKVFFCFTISNVFFKFDNTLKKIKSKNNLGIIKGMMKNRIEISWPDEDTGEPVDVITLLTLLEDEESDIIREIYFTRALGTEQWDEIISCPWRGRIRIVLCDETSRETYSFPIPNDNSFFENGIYISFFDKIRIKKIIEKAYKRRETSLPTW